MTDKTNPVRESSDMSVREAGDAFLELFTKKEESSREAPTSEQPDEVAEVAEEESTEEQAEESEGTSDQPEASSEEDESSEDEESALFLIDGEEVTAEQLEEWKKAGLREDDYRRKTQALADEKRKWEEQKAQDEAQLRQQWEERLAIASNAVTDELAEYAEVDWDRLRAEDPIEYQTKWIDFQRAQVKAQKVQQQIQEALQAEKQGIQQHSQEYMQEQMQLVREKVPEFADKEKASALVSELMTYMLDRGFTQNEINNVVSAKEILLVHDAMQWQKLQSKANDSVKKVTKKTKVIRPGTGSETAKATKAKKAAEAKANKLKSFKDRGGKVKDAANMFMELGLF